MLTEMISEWRSQKIGTSCEMYFHKTQQIATDENRKAFVCSWHWPLTCWAEPKQFSLWRPTSLYHVKVSKHFSCMIVEPETVFNTTNHIIGKHRADENQIKFFKLFVNFNFLLKKKKKIQSQHLRRWAAITLELSCSVTTVIDVEVGPRGSGTMSSDRAALAGCLWWLKAGPHAVTDRWPRSGPSGQMWI